jgi:hypothetical protein
LIRTPKVRHDEAASAMKVQAAAAAAERSPYAAALIKAITDRCRTKGGYWG